MKESESECGTADEHALDGRLGRQRMGLVLQCDTTDNGRLLFFRLFIIQDLSVGDRGEHNLPILCVAILSCSLFIRYFCSTFIPLVYDESRKIMLELKDDRSFTVWRHWHRAPGKHSFYTPVPAKGQVPSWPAS